MRALRPAGAPSRHRPSRPRICSTPLRAALRPGHNSRGCGTLHRVQGPAHQTQAFTAVGLAFPCPGCTAACNDAVLIRGAGTVVATETPAQHHCGCDPTCRRAIAAPPVAAPDLQHTASRCTASGAQFPCVRRAASRTGPSSPNAGPHGGRVSLPCPGCAAASHGAVLIRGAGTVVATEAPGQHPGHWQHPLTAPRRATAGTPSNRR